MKLGQILLNQRQSIRTCCIVTERQNLPRICDNVFVHNLVRIIDFNVLCIGIVILYWWYKNIARTFGVE